MSQYDAFISYSQSKDRAIAAALQSTIQSLGKPWYQLRALRVFRDDTTIAATPHLWSAIEQALNQSRFFILLASKEAASSRWVDDEVSYWLKHKNRDTLLLALTDGELVWDHSLRNFQRPVGMPLPPAIESAFAEEPRWIDLRSYRGGADTRDASFIELAANFASVIHGIPKEDLLSREIRQQRRNLLVAWSIAGSLLLLLGMAGWQWWRAERTAQAATATANELVFDIADRFRDLQGIPNDLVISVLKKAQSVTERLLRLDAGGDQVARSAAASLAALSVVLGRQGQGPESVRAASQAVNLFEQLAALDGTPDRAIDLATAYDRLGEANRIAGNSMDARKAFTRSYEIATTLLRDHKDHQWLKRIAAVGLEKSGELSLLTNPNDALIEFVKSRRLREELIRQAPSPEIERQLSISHERIADALIKLQRNDEALREYKISLDLTRKLFEGDRSRTDFTSDYATINQKLGRISNELDDSEAALQYFGTAVKVSSQLAATNLLRSDLQVEAARSKLAFSEALSKSNQTKAAIEQLVEMLLVLPKPEQASRESDRLSYDANLLLGQLLMSAGSADSAIENFRRAEESAKRIALAEGKDSNFALKLVFAVSQEAEALIYLGKPIEARVKSEFVVGEIRSLVAANLAPRAAIVQILGNLAWYAIIGNSSQRALQAADEALELDNQANWIKINKGHALLVLGMRNQAFEQYRAACVTPRPDGKAWIDVVNDDLDRLRKSGVVFDGLSEAEVAEIR